MLLLFIFSSVLEEVRHFLKASTEYLQKVLKAINVMFFIIIIIIIIIIIYIYIYSKTVMITVNKINSVTNVGVTHHINLTMNSWTAFHNFWKFFVYLRNVIVLKTQNKFFSKNFLVINLMFFEQRQSIYFLSDPKNELLRWSITREVMTLDMDWETQCTCMEDPKKCSSKL